MAYNRAVMAIKHKKLKEWVAAGLMTDAQADAIHAYEDDKKGGRFGRGLVGLSIFAILVGVLSIIAANWHEIPGSVKIGVHALLNVVVGFVALYSDKKGKDIWREGAALAFLGLTFTLIILVGQVFQLTGTPADATLFWIIITLPFFLLMGRGYMTAWPWVLAFLTTVFLVSGENLEDIPKEYRAFLIVGLWALLPLAMMGDGTVKLFRRWRPALADVSLKAGIFFMALHASISLSLWPVGNDLHFLNLIYFRPEQGVLLLAVGLGAIALHAFLKQFYRDDIAEKSGAYFAAASLVGIIVPLILPMGGGAIFPALAFISYWVFVGWLAQGMHKMRIVSLAITLIAIRIFIIYVEVFGSLLETGYGLISGGIVMLGLIYGARRLNKRLTKKVAA